jgi:hypothetical protein
MRSEHGLIEAVAKQVAILKLVEELFLHLIAVDAKLPEAHRLENRKFKITKYIVV